MLTLEDIKDLGNGVYSFDYEAKDKTVKTVKFSKETLCYITTTRDKILICANYEQGIHDQYINDIEDRCDYLILSVILCKEDKFAFNDIMLNIRAEQYHLLPDYEFNTIYGDSWYINRNNVLFVTHDKAVIAKSPGNFVSENIGIIKFKGIYGLEVVKEIDAKWLEEILTNS